MTNRKPANTATKPADYTDPSFTDAEMARVIDRAVSGIGKRTPAPYRGGRNYPKLEGDA